MRVLSVEDDPVALEPVERDLRPAFRAFVPVSALRAARPAGAGREASAA